jgi:6-phosphogluconate dehydrogenase, decarboxylating
MSSDIGIFGLGTMGGNLALQLVEKGYTVSVYNRTKEKTETFVNKNKSNRLIPTYSLKEFLNSLCTPRKIILLVKAGNPVDEAIENISHNLEKNDIIIDAGNSFFRDTDRRYNELKAKGYNFLGLGISGGIEGARKGLSIMAGGSEEGYLEMKDILNAISAKYGEESCNEYFGKGGAGHFVKMIHNGVEYAIIESISETYFILKKNLGLDNEQISNLFYSWNNEELNSFLLYAAVNSLRIKEEKGYLIDFILDKAEQKGTGIWTVLTSLEANEPILGISSAVYSRLISSKKEDRVTYSELIDLSRTNKTVKLNEEEIKNALLLSFYLSYIQGINILKKCQLFSYDFKYQDCLKVWRNGSIIRSKVLLNLYSISIKENDIIKTDFILNLIKEKVDDFIKTVAYSMLSHIPCITLSSNLNYLLSIFYKNLPSNLTQALRDYFGGHGFERIDKKGIFHIYGIE